MNNIDKFLERLKQQNKNELIQYGEGFLLPPASAATQQSLIDLGNKHLGVQLSAEYLQCLSLSDGFSMNGFNLYASAEKTTPYFLPGIIQSNLEFWQEDGLGNFVAYGDESGSRLVYDIKKDKYLLVDNVTWESVAEFDLFFDLIDFTFEQAQLW